MKTLDLFSTRDGMRGDDVSSVLSYSFFFGLVMRQHVE